jgi:DNA-binding transcriptional MerR regulator
MMTEVSVRTLRNYVAKRLLTPTEFRGTATRYQRRGLLRLLLLLRARKETKLTLAAIKRELDRLSECELEARLHTGPLPAAAAAALGIPSPPAARTSDVEQPLERWTARLETWQRVQLLPGLELLLGPNPSLAAARAAHMICSQYLK